MARKEPAAAEALLREGLRIRARRPAIVPGRRRTLLDDDWSVGATKSLLGAALVEIGRYEEAETLLLEARRDLEAMPAARAEIQTPSPASSSSTSPGASPRARRRTGRCSPPRSGLRCPPVALPPP